MVACWASAQAGDGARGFPSQAFPHRRRPTFLPVVAAFRPSAVRTCISPSVPASCSPAVSTSSSPAVPTSSSPRRHDARDGKNRDFFHPGSIPWPLGQGALKV